MDYLLDYLVSWNATTGLDSIDSILRWIEEKNKTLKVNILRSKLPALDSWFYDEHSGTIHNRDNSFFSIAGVQYHSATLDIEQPIIVQNEIGILGIIAKRINGIVHLLMQAKIEPGNINKIQISPTIQATKSNFTQKHGGQKPAYLDYFVNAKKYEIVVDQIQSEQSSRFLKKRNRNLIIDIGNEEIEVLDSHKWMTIGQVKRLMAIDNLVNMDTRTVLSCIPFCIAKGIKNDGRYEHLVFNSMFNDDPIPYRRVFNALNDYKMFSDKTIRFVPLKELPNWRFQDEEIASDIYKAFKIIYCDIEIEKREVRRWCQPLVAARDIAMFGLIARKRNDKYEFLVCLKEEVGCFDMVEFGPTIQSEDCSVSNAEPLVKKVFLKHLSEGKGIVFNGLLSEEGGRFYHEQNKNVVMEIDDGELPIDPPSGYLWLDLKTLNYLIQSNNYVNIQLRNLLSLLRV